MREGGRKRGREGGREGGRLKIYPVLIIFRQID